MKRLSIITVNLDNSPGLERTIDSVTGQTSGDIEYLVIDGGSKDSSLAIIEKHSKSIDYWVSEPDGGIYQAMNKGIRRANGEYCLFLNSGDWLHEATIVEAALARATGDADIYYADLRVSDGKESWTRTYPARIDESFFISDTLSHQNSFIRRSLLVEAGLYREDFRIAGDWFFFLLAAHKFKAKFSSLGEPIADYFPFGISTDSRYEEIKESEHRRGIEEVFGVLGPSLYELRSSRSTVYADIVRNFGYSQWLDRLLRAYRRLARAMPRSLSTKAVR